MIQLNQARVSSAFTVRVLVLALSRTDVERLLDLPACIEAVEAGLRCEAGNRAHSAILGLHARDGGLHGKAAYLAENGEGSPAWFAAKLNSNFPQNRQRYALPTIQGLLALFDAQCGRLVAIMDSGALTVIRTAAATGVAARLLARPDATSLTIIGCGAQAFAQVRAVASVRPIRRVVTIDAVAAAADRLATRVRDELRIDASARGATRGAPHDTEIIVTCTPARSPILGSRDVLPGTFIAAVGADNEDKSEIAPELMASSDIVVDNLTQASTIGDLHHAIAAGVMSPADVRGTLGGLLAGSSPVAHDRLRTTIFDSTGVAVEDVAAAVLVYKKALESRLGADLVLS